MPKKIQPAMRELVYELPPSGTSSYVCLAKDLSAINRRLYAQGKQYFIEKAEVAFLANPANTDMISLTVATAGDTWMVHNAHTKGEALWNEMNKLVLKDNPSLKGKWADYKVYLDDHHKAAGNLVPLDGDGNPVLMGEWDYSTYVMPQHDVDPATGEPLAAIEYDAHLVGNDSGTASGSTQGLVKAYALSRAMVQDTDPEIPAGFESGFFNKLTDQGSQEPELALRIGDENDQPPYDQDNYPGGGSNADAPWVQELAVATLGHPMATVSGITAECGLLKIGMMSYLNGEASPAPLTGAILRITVMPGTYKGVAALPMGQ